MSLRPIILVAAIVALAFIGDVVRGQTERFELEGNLKFFGVGNGIIFPDNTKQTTAGNDLVCVGCVEEASNLGCGRYETPEPLPPPAHLPAVRETAGAAARGVRAGGRCLLLCQRR